MFINSHSYHAADIVRIVGFTKTRVRLEHVPGCNFTDDGFQGGSGEIDQKWLNQHPVSPEAHSFLGVWRPAGPDGQDDRLNAVSHKSDYYIETDPDYVFRFVDFETLVNT